MITLILLMIDPNSLACRCNLNPTVLSRPEDFEFCDCRSLTFFSIKLNIHICSAMQVDINYGTEDSGVSYMIREMNRLK